MACSRASFFHSCLKVPVHPDTRMPSPGYERPSAPFSPPRGPSRSSKVTSRTSSASRASSARPPRPPSTARMSVEMGSVAPVLKFYESIPDYADLNHLSDKDFYARVRELRFLQRNYVTAMTEPKTTTSPNNWQSGIQGSKCLMNASRAATPSSWRTGSPKMAWGSHTPSTREDVFSSTLSSPLSSPQRSRKQRDRRKPKTANNSGAINRSGWAREASLVSDSEEDRSRACKNAGWREAQFRASLREEEKRDLKQLRRDLMLSPRRRTPSPVKGHEVPLTSRLPMYHAILLEQELRRERLKRKSKARLLAQLRPFSFDVSPERSLAKNWKSLPELRDLDSGRSVFRATPMPWQIYGIEAEIRRQEEDYLRKMRREIRAEEMLARSMLPRSMQVRCRSQSPPAECRTSRASSAAVFGAETKRSPYASTCTSRVSSAAALPRRPSPIRNNLAAVLRIEASRRRAEREAALRLEEARQLEEVRSRAKVVRRRPAWRRMASVSARRELALRAEARREEERSRQHQHARHMGTMMNRVLHIPTLFERQHQEGLRFKMLEADEGRRRMKQQEFRKQRVISFSPEEEKKDDEPEFEEKDDLREECDEELEN
ncbi:protein FAM161A [Neocloeon triangulifer]|uniref:protein FAM161A n=1 Tax=Neocloeon triangulifer TaxID=2078957 RepID=UPI00286F20F5|nr:protein FAM161A [Neocloeon triangulifer]